MQSKGSGYACLQHSVHSYPYYSLVYLETVLRDSALNHTETVQMIITRQMLTTSWSEPECILLKYIDGNDQLYSQRVAYKRFIGTYMVPIGLYEITSVKQ